MRRRVQGRRLSVGLVSAGLLAVGLLPVTPAHAAPAQADMNLALGRPVTTSGAHGSYPASHVTDGSQATYWEGPGGSFPQWVQVDLGAATDVSDVVLKLPASWEARSETVAVEGSTDGRDFTTLSAGAARAFSPSAANTVTLGVDAEARYIRVKVSANSGWNAAQLSEVEVRGTSGEDPGEPPAGTNLALRKPIEASSVTQDYVASHANDGSATTYWEAGAQSATLTTMLGADADLTGVVLKLNPDPAWGPRTQSIQVLGRKAGATGFTSLKDRADYTFSPAGNRNTVTIPVTGRYADVRLQFSGNTGAGGGQVAEFEVVGTAAPAPDLTVTGLTWSPASPSEADPVTVDVTVRNAGTAASPATKANVSLEGTVAGTADVGALAAGASVTVPVKAGTHPMGSYGVSAVVDPSDTVPELDNSNNSRNAASRLVVGQAPGPDLEVTGITTSPASPAVGAKVGFTVAVRNRGTSAVPAGSVTRLTVGATTLNGTTGSIAAGATADVAISGTWTAVSGGATLTASADATGVVTETNENNNTHARSLVVGRGAAVPYTEYEAEDGRHTGTLLTADAKRTFGHTNFATESSGRRSVRLNSTGQYVEFTSTAPSNSIVVRNSVPDAADGGARRRRSASTPTGRSSAGSPCPPSTVGCTARPTTRRA